MGKMFFTQHVLDVFAANKIDHEQLTQLMIDVALKKEIFSDNRVISQSEAETKIHSLVLGIYGLGEKPTPKELRRAREDHDKEFFRVIEDAVSVVIATGYGNEPWFEILVDGINIETDDRQDFLIDKDAILVVSKSGNSHHDHILQRIGAGERKTVPTAIYTVKIGEDINKYIVGQTDWTKMITAISEAYIKQIQEMVYAEVSNISSQVPASVVGTGVLSASTKEAFDDIIETVSAANDGAEVIVMGTKNALKKVNVLADVDWGSKDQRDSMMNTGTIGIYEGTRLVEIPQRFKDKALTQRLMDDTKLIIMAVGDANDKPVKFIDQGDTRIVEVTDRGEGSGRIDDLMSYEVQRAFGVGLVVGRVMGQWTLTRN